MLQLFSFNSCPIFLHLSSIHFLPFFSPLLACHQLRFSLKTPKRFKYLLEWFTLFDIFVSNFYFRSMIDSPLLENLIIIKGIHIPIIITQPDFKFPPALSWHWTFHSKLTQYFLTTCPKISNLLRHLSRALTTISY